MSSPKRLLALCFATITAVSLGQPAWVVAGPMRTAKAQSVRVRRAELRTYWNNYYSQALKNQSMKVKGLNALKVLRVNANGTLPQIPMVAYLQWRRSLAPARFAKYHPELSRWLVRDLVVRGLPTTPTTPTNPQPGGVNPPPPPQIPEPSSVLIAGMAAGAALWWRHRGRGSR